MKNNPVVYGEVGVKDPTFHLAAECPAIPADGARPVYWSEAKELVMIPRLCEACGPFSAVVAERTLAERFAAGDFKTSDIQVGDELVVWNPYGGRKHNGSSMRYRINRTHFDPAFIVQARFVPVAAQEGTTEKGTVYLHCIAYRVNQGTGSSFGREGWRCINRERITAIYRNGEAL
jgi:hypothetical protein